MNGENRQEKGAVRLEVDQSGCSDGLDPDARFVVGLVPVQVQVREDLGDRGIQGCVSLGQEAKFLVEEPPREHASVLS